MVSEKGDRLWDSAAKPAYPSPDCGNTFSGGAENPKIEAWFVCLGIVKVGSMFNVSSSIRITTSKV